MKFCDQAARGRRDITGSMNGNGAPRAEFARDVRLGLCEAKRKWLPAKHLYDAVGSTLFEAITHLPEYGLTRADERVLRRAAAALPDHITSKELIVAELGSGGGAKTRLLLEAFATGLVRSYCPIDISSDALQRCCQELEGLVSVLPYHGAYVDGVRSLRESRPTDAPLLLLFLGSSIGNLGPQDRTSSLASIRSALRPRDYCLIGFDLVKPKSELLRAYDDPTGVTAAFNRNVLGRVNRELGGNFDLASFNHMATYDEYERRVEMHLVATHAQVARIPLAGGTCTLRRDETIWTESSYKFERDEIDDSMRAAGFRPLGAWVDDDWPLLEGLWQVDG